MDKSTADGVRVVGARPSPHIEKSATLRKVSLDLPHVKVGGPKLGSSRAEHLNKEGDRYEAPLVEAGGHRPLRQGRAQEEPRLAKDRHRGGLCFVRQTGHGNSVHGSRSSTSKCNFTYLTSVSLYFTAKLLTKKSRADTTGHLPSRPR